MRVIGFCALTLQTDNLYLPNKPKKTYAINSKTNSITPPTNWHG